MSWFSEFILCRLLGWKIINDFPHYLDKYIVIAGPHTSNWDFFVGVAAMFALGVRVVFLGKHTLFRWPMGPFMRALGGVPVAVAVLWTSPASRSACVVVYGAAQVTVSPTDRVPAAVAPSLLPECAKCLSPPPWPWLSASLC